MNAQSKSLFYFRQHIQADPLVGFFRLTTFFEGEIVGPRFGFLTNKVRLLKSHNALRNDLADLSMCALAVGRHEGSRQLALAALPSLSTPSARNSSDGRLDHAFTHRLCPVRLRLGFSGRAT